MFYKIFINNLKILLYLLKLKSISEKREKNHTSEFNVVKCIYIFEPTDRFIYEHILILICKTFAYVVALLSLGNTHLSDQVKMRLIS